MRVFKNKWFDRFCRKQKITNGMLLTMVKEIDSGQTDTEYGGCLIKQRLARKNQGKSGGYRCIVLYRFQEKVFMVYGFAKKDRDNLEDDEVVGFKALAEEMLNLTDESLETLIKSNALIEVNYDKS